MLRLVSYNSAFYAVTAAAFLLFTVVFTRQYGVRAYADFSILLNSMTALLLLSNYQGYLVSYAVAENRDAFRRYARIAVPYTIAAALVAATLFWFVTRTPMALLPLMVLAFALMFGCTLPATVILATPQNWRLVAYRSVYQVLILVLFYGLYVATGQFAVSFALGAICAAAAFLAQVARRARRDLKPAPSAHPDAPAAVIFLAASANGATVLSSLVDKFAINYLDVGPDPACVGVYFIYYDIIFRAITIYAIMVYPLTYAFLTLLRERRSPNRIFALMIGGTVLVTVATIAAGYLIVPWLYGISIACAPLLPLAMAVFLAFNGVGLLVVAFCNAAGYGRILVVQNIMVLAITVAAVASIAFVRSTALTVTELTVALALGKAVTVITLLTILYRLFHAKDLPAVAEASGDNG